MKKYEAYISLDLKVTPQLYAQTEAEAEEMFSYISVEKLLDNISDVSTVDIHMVRVVE